MHVTNEAAEITIRRTYSKHTIVWARQDADGTPYTARWSGYRSADEAQRTIDGATDAGVIVTEMFTVDIPGDQLHLYRPGDAGVYDEVVA